jgi:hypothetical protein
VGSGGGDSTASGGGGGSKESGKVAGTGAGGSLAARSLPRSLDESSTKENLVGGQERSTGETYAGNII